MSVNLLLRQYHFLTLFVWCCALYTSHSIAAIKVIDDVTIIKTFKTSPFGINMNYIRDHDKNRVAPFVPFTDALALTGTHWVRYPGGQMADFYRFAVPPYKIVTASATRKGYQQQAKQNLLYDLNDYLTLINGSDIEGYFVLPIEEAILDPARENEIIEHAKAWLMYVNKHSVKKVTYWELGNENWKHKDKLEQISQLVGKMARELKEIDPDIKIGSSVNNKKWAKALSEPAHNLDFIAISSYANFNKGYREYLKSKPQRLARKANAIAKELAGTNIELVIAEYNMASRKGEWNSADFGRAIAFFNLSLELLKVDQLSKLGAWPTRWMEDRDADTQRDLFNSHNSPTTLGVSYSLLANNFLAKQHPTLYWDNSLYIYPMSNNNQVNLFIVNKSAEGKQVELTFKSELLCNPETTSLFVGKKDLALKSTFNTLSSFTYIKQKNLSLSVQGNSIQLVKCENP